MGSREGVVDVDIAVGGQCFGKGGVVLLFRLVETGVFEQQDIAIVHLGDGIGCRRADAVGGEEDGAIEALLRPTERCGRGQIR